MFRNSSQLQLHQSAYEPLNYRYLTEVRSLNFASMHSPDLESRVSHAAVSILPFAPELAPIFPPRDSLSLVISPIRSSAYHPIVIRAGVAVARG